MVNKPDLGPKPGQLPTKDPKLDKTPQPYNHPDRMSDSGVVNPPTGVPEAEPKKPA